MEHDKSTSCTTALHTFGDLMKAHQPAPGTQMSDKLATFNAGVDHLGMVLNLAVHMV